MPLRVAAHCGLTLVYIAAQIALFFHYPIQTLDDSRAYIQASMHPWLSLDLWASHEKPSGLPAMLKLWGSQPTVFIVFQAIFSAFCYYLSAVLIARTFRHPLIGCIAFAILLCVPLIPGIAAWPNALMTEALSHSWLILTLGASVAWVHTLPRPTLKLSALFLISALGASLSRDSNQYIALGLGLGLIPLFGWKHRHIRMFWFVTLGLIIVYQLAHTSSQHQSRWVGALNRAYADRILVDPEKIEYMRSHGLPEKPHLGNLSTKHQAEKWVDSPAFQSWIRERGYRAYQGYLLHFWKESFSAVFSIDTFRVLLKADLNWHADRAPLRFQNHLHNALWAPFSSPWFLAFLLIGVFVTLGVYKKFSAAGLFLLWLCLIAPLAYVVYHGCSIEVDRHAAFLRVILLPIGWVMLLRTLEIFTFLSRKPEDLPTLH